MVIVEKGEGAKMATRTRMATTHETLLQIMSKITREKFKRLPWKHKEGTKKKETTSKKQMQRVGAWKELGHQCTMGIVKKN